MVDIYFVLLPVLLGFAALFAASEASLFSLRRSQLETLRLSKPKLYGTIKNLVFQPDAFLSTIIIGNECLNIFIGTLIATLLQKYLPVLDTYILVILSVTATSLALLLFSEILPKILAFRMPVRTAAALANPMAFAHWALTPFRAVFLSISKTIIRWIGIQPLPPSAVSEKDFLTLVEVGVDSGSLERQEKEMIVNVFHFSDLSVETVMTPWKKVFSISENLPVTEVLSQVRANGFSRVPVVAEDNRVIGMLYTKELLKLMLHPEQMNSNEALKQAILPPYVVSSTKKVSSIFRDFKGKKIHIALVVDDTGKHLGIVTLEDVLNALLQTQRRIEGAAR